MMNQKHALLRAYVYGVGMIYPREPLEGVDPVQDNIFGQLREFYGRLERYGREGLEVVTMPHTNVILNEWNDGDDGPWLESVDVYDGDVLKATIRQGMRPLFMTFRVQQNPYRLHYECVSSDGVRFPIALLTSPDENGEVHLPHAGGQIFDTKVIGNVYENELLDHVIEPDTDEEGGLHVEAA